MRIKEKQDALYLRGVVIPCGMTDATNDKACTAEDIKKIFTNYLTHETDVQHTFIKNFGVYTLENTITETETEIAGQKVPAKSWTASVMVVNPEIKTMVTDQKLNGFSLGAVGDDGLNENINFLNKSLRYEDLNDADELNPLFISLVDNAANGFKWEVLEYGSFLAKSTNFDGDNMTDNEKQKEIENEGTVPAGLFERTINAFLKKSEETAPEEPLEKAEETADPKEEEETLEKADEDLTNAQLLEQLPAAVAEAVIVALKEAAKKEEPLEKAEDADETLEKAEEDKKEEEEKLEKSEGETKEGINDSKNTLTKSTTKVVDNTLNDAAAEQFLNSETRDSKGRNKKYMRI